MDIIMGVPKGLVIAGSVVISFILWTIVFRLSSYLQPHRSYDWNGRTVTCVHGIVISVMSLVFGIWFIPSLFTDPGGESNFYDVLVQVVCLGYFFFDTIWCLWFNLYGHETNIYIIHHFIAMVAMMMSLYQGVSGVEINVTIFLSEVTSPMLQFRWFMREMALKKSNVWYQLNDFVFIVTFIAMRGVLLPYLAYYEIMHSRPSVVFKFFAVSFCVMNYIITVGIIQFAYRKYKNIYREWKLGANSNGREKSVSGKNSDRMSNSSVTFD